MKHERQILIPGWDQDRIQDLQVTVVGCGALGSQAATALARLGVGSITLVDPDILEEHNLENQLYDASDIGKAKVKALRERIHAIDPDLPVSTMPVMVQDAQIRTEIVLGCLDNVAARYYLNHQAYSEGFTYIDAGIEAYAGSIKTVKPGETSCYECWPILPNTPPKPGCSQDPVPSTYVTAAVAANLQVMQLLRIALGLPWKDMLLLDLRSGSVVERTLARNPACGLCA